MAVKERVRRHREDLQLQGFVRIEVVVPSECAEQVRKLAFKLRSKKAKANLVIVRSLISEAYAKFGASCLDNISVDTAHAGVRQARVVADALMTRGNKDAFSLGRRIRDEAHL